MGESFVLTQVSEGSLLFNQDFGVSINYISRQYFEFIYKIYENGVLQEQTERTPSNLYYYKPQKYGVYKVVVEVYEGEKRIEVLTSPILDYLEDFILIEEASIVYESGEIRAQVTTEFELPKEYYAFYLKRGNEVIEKIFYTRQSWWHFKIQEPGEYCVQVFVRLIKNSGFEDKVIAHTEKIKIEKV